MRSRSEYSLRPLPLGPTIGALFLLDDGLGLDERVGRHGRDHALLFDDRRPCPPARSSQVAPLPPPPPPAPLAPARRTAPPPRRWRSCPGSRSCRRASTAPDRAWACRAGGTRRSSPSCCRPRAAPAPPPAPAAAPPRSSSAVQAAAPLQPSPPLPAPPAFARRTAPPLRLWQSCPGSHAGHCASPAPGRAWACRDFGGSRRGSPSCCRPRAASAPPPAPAAAPPRSSAVPAAPPLQPSAPPPAPPAIARCTAPPPRR
eukprot:scaffold36916_cov60-Phaeocystis_antarctica.AAC.3